MSDEASHQGRMDSPGLDPTMKEIERTLGAIDFEHAIELEKLDRSAVADDLKQHIRKTLRNSHRERRQPYVDVLNRFRMQQRGRSFAS